jgi:hypothetical protein
VANFGRVPTDSIFFRDLSCYQAKEKKEKEDTIIAYSSHLLPGRVHENCSICLLKFNNDAVVIFEYLNESSRNRR